MLTAVVTGQASAIQYLLMGSNITDERPAEAIPHQR